MAESEYDSEYDAKYEAVVKNHPYFIYDTKTEQPVSAGDHVACGRRDELDKIIVKFLGGDYDRYDIRRNG